MKTRRNSKTGFMNSKSKVVNVYKNTNSKISSILNNSKNNNIKCRQGKCLNSVNILNVSWDVWRDFNKLNNGKAISPGSSIDVSFNTPNIKQHFGIIKDVKISNNKNCLKVGEYNCSDAFKDNGINIKLLIEPSINCDNTIINKLSENTDWSLYFNTIHTISKAVDTNVNIGEVHIIYKKSNRIGSIYRAPIAGFRKTLCNNENTKNKYTQEVYKDPYSLIFKNSSDVYKKVCYDQRIRSGMQEKTVISQCKDKCCDKQQYSFSYNEYNKHYRLNTYDRNLEINKPTDSNSCLSGDCIKTNYSKSSGCKHCTTEKCNNNKMVNTVWKPNNSKFKQQGSVSSGLRLERLKLDTIKVANAKCKDNTCSTLENGDKVGRGKYFAGKPRFDGWMFNKNHKEVTKFRMYR